MSDDTNVRRLWAIAAKGVLGLWLMIALVQQYPTALRQGYDDLVMGMRPLSRSPGSTPAPSGVQELAAHLRAFGAGRGWPALLILPLPAQFERDPGRFDELDVAALGGLADDIFRLAYSSFPQTVDVAFLDSRGRLRRVSYRPEERFIPAAPLDLALYEIVAVHRDAAAMLGRMEPVAQTSDGAIVIYRRPDQP